MSLLPQGKWLIRTKFDKESAYIPKSLEVAEKA